jgi:hypothetical protein
MSLATATSLEKALESLTPSEQLKVETWAKESHLSLWLLADYGHFRTDRISIIFINVWFWWTILIFVMTLFLFRIRHESYVKLRNIPLVLASLFFLHFEITWSLLSYSINGSVSCRLQFWISNMFLP